MEAKELATTVSNGINNMSFNYEEFIAEMGNDHRTLQQSFTRLCLAWLNHVGNDDYRYDGRNEASHKIAKELIEMYTEKHGYVPNYLPLI